MTTTSIKYFILFLLAMLTVNLFAGLPEGRKGSSKEARTELNNQAISPILQLIEQLQAEEPESRVVAANLLTSIAEEWQLRLQDICTQKTDSPANSPPRLAAQVLAKMFPKKAIPLWTNNISERHRARTRTELDLLGDYPFAQALRTIGWSSIPEIMRRFGQTPSKDISDKDIELLLIF